MTSSPPPAVRLGALLRAHRGLSGDLLTALGVGLCDALDAAERTGIGNSPIVGRVALTPDSFIIGEGGALSLKPSVAADGDPHAGFRTWAAPEQLREGPTDARAWVFSIGALLFEAGTGDPLFEGPTPDAANHMVLHGLDDHLVLVALKSRLRKVEPGIEGVVRACLASEPNSRPDSFQTLKVLLEDLGGGDPRGLRALAAAASTVAARAAPFPVDESLPGFLSAPTGYTDPAMPVPDFGPPAAASLPTPNKDPFASPSASDFWSTVGGMPEEGSLPGEAPAPADDSSEGIGGQSFEIALDQPARPVSGPPEPPAFLREMAASSAGQRPGSPGGGATPPPAPPSELVAAQAELKTARVRPIREVPPSVLNGLRRLRTGAWITLGVLLFGWGLVWLQVVPGLPVALSDGIEAAMAPLAAATPEPVRTRVAAAWTSRSDRDRAARLWNRFVDLLPSELQRELRPPPDKKASLDWAGEPAGSGFLPTVVSMLEPDSSLPEATGRLELALTYAGSARQLRGSVTWTASPVDDPRGADLAADIARVEGTVPLSEAPDRDVVTGQGLEPFALPAGFWDIVIEYTESKLTPTQAGAVTGVRISPSRLTRLTAGAEIPAGLVRPRILVDGQEHVDNLTVAVLQPAAGAAIQRAEAEVAQAVLLGGDPPRATRHPIDVGDHAPTWIGPADAIPPLPQGSWTMRLAYDDGIHWPSVAWYADVNAPAGMGTEAPTWRIERDEPLHPSGPGVRLTATNMGRDVSLQTKVFLYRAEENVLHAAAVAQGRGARYFDVPPGEYTLRLVYQPMGEGGAMFGERVVPSFKVTAQGVTETTVDVGYEFAWIDLAVTDAGVDISADVDLIVLREGVDRQAGSRTLDEDGVGKHALPANTYDIYVRWSPTDGRDPVDVVFRAVELGAGQRWVQRWEVANLPWSAKPPRR